MTPPIDTDQHAMQDSIKRVIDILIPTCEQEGMEETPQRWAKAMLEYTQGYRKDPAEIIKMFEIGTTVHGQLVTVQAIPFYSMCEHHLAPFFGEVSITYVPNGNRVLGLSKMPRIVDVFARRAQTQERFTSQIAEALFDGLDPLGVAVIANARHMCMESRGVCKSGANTTTTRFIGPYFDDYSHRAAFMT